MSYNPNVLITQIRETTPNAVKIFTQGGCYRFYDILKVYNPSAECYYNSDHFIAKIRGKFYDIRGEVSGEGYLPFEEFFPLERRERMIKQMLSVRGLPGYFN